MNPSLLRPCLDVVSIANSHIVLSGKLGVRTLDLGNPILSMHSIRETGGTYDVEHGINLFESFYRHYGELESTIVVD